MTALALREAFWPQGKPDTKSLVLGIIGGFFMIVLRLAEEQRLKRVRKQKE
jgi:hypothetical protein